VNLGLSLLFVVRPDEAAISWRWPGMEFATQTLSDLCESHQTDLPDARKGLAQFERKV
jgi:hypothetical protein